MGVEAEEEGGPAEEEDAARAMEPLDAGAAGSLRGVRLPGDGGKGREGWRGRAGARGGRWGAASRSRSGLASTGAEGSCTLERPCIPAHMGGVHLPSRGDPWCFRRLRVEDSEDLILLGVETWPQSR